MVSIWWMAASPASQTACACVAAERVHQLAEARVGDHRQVRGGVAGVDLAQLRALEHDHALAGRRQQVGGGQAGDAAAHDDHVRVLVVIERPEGRTRQ